MTICVLGATGGTGSVVTRQLLEAGRPVRAAVRRPDAAHHLRASGAEVVPLDLTSATPDALAAAFRGCDAVVNAAAGRSTSGRTARQIDRDGVIAAIDAAVAAGVPRWVQISMMGSDNPRRLPFFLRFLRGVAAAKGEADAHLARSSLRWTIVRPPWLTDGPRTGTVTVARNLTGGRLSREDLAAVAIACLSEPAAEHRDFDVIGGSVPLDRALASLATLS
jgi:uncharacterized protein YbjT (DUF2867 family)